MIDWGQIADKLVAKEVMEGLTETEAWQLDEAIEHLNASAEPAIYVAPEEEQ